MYVRTYVRMYVLTLNANANPRTNIIRRRGLQHTRRLGHDIYIYIYIYINTIGILR